MMSVSALGAKIEQGARTRGRSLCLGRCRRPGRMATLRSEIQDEGNLDSDTGTQPRTAGHHQKLEAAGRTLPRAFRGLLASTASLEHSRGCYQGLRALQGQDSKVPDTQGLAFGCGLHICFLEPWAYLLPTGLPLQITPGTLPCSRPESTQCLAQGKPHVNVTQNHKTLSECHPGSQNTAKMASLQASQGGPHTQISGSAFKHR
uniref:Uncharacterized protein n=1 Tax=Rousettus aegyptiacus TaxID=9407 RepID=A0A7J8BT16_ROUAE|nr:hypothetical protein HJG63_009642 [Rousettus aegyptiacus]